MVKIQIDVPKELNKKLEIYKAKKECYDKRQAIIKILQEALK